MTRLGFFRSLATVSKSVPLLALELETAEVASKLNLSDKILALQENSISSDEAHFKIGGEKRYFPKARVVLMRPSAKHTPYQANFVVPKSFNRLDLRDYLWHVYGLRALSITTQLLPGTFVRYGPSPRFRKGQIKKMTIEMEQPFVWPDDSTSGDSVLSLTKFRNEATKSTQALQMNTGSDLLKPIKGLGGVYKYLERVVKHEAEPFVPRQVGRSLLNQKKQALKIDAKKEEQDNLQNYLLKKINESSSL